MEILELNKHIHFNMQTTYFQTGIFLILVVVVHFEHDGAGLCQARLLMPIKPRGSVVSSWQMGVYGWRGVGGQHFYAQCTGGINIFTGKWGGGANISIP